MFDISKITFFGFVLMRITGFVIFNPILGRKNIPGIVKAAFIMCITIFTYYYVPYVSIEAETILEYMIMLLKEALMGAVLGFIVNIFASIVIGGCEIIDMQLGLGMAKMYDPQSNIQMGITSKMYNILFMFIFFAMGCHLNMINICLESYKIVPYGEVVIFTKDLPQNMLLIVINTIVMMVKFAIPILALELFLEMGIGLLMKAVPQINVFIINIQLKLLLGISIMIIALPIFSDFLSRNIDLMFSALESIVRLM